MSLRITTGVPKAWTKDEFETDDLSPRGERETGQERSFEKAPLVDQARRLFNIPCLEGRTLGIADVQRTGSASFQTCSRCSRLIFPFHAPSQFLLSLSLSLPLCLFHSLSLSLSNSSFSLNVFFYMKTYPRKAIVWHDSGQEEFNRGTQLGLRQKYSNREMTACTTSRSYIEQGMKEWTGSSRNDITVQYESETKCMERDPACLCRRNSPWFDWDCGNGS